MKLFGKLFGGIRLSWIGLIIYAVVTGAAVGLLNCVPALEGTSLVYPAVNYEYWIVAALFVIMNSEQWPEAVLRTFIFFVISQPLIYLVEVPFKAMGWGLFMYYKNWILPTFLTIPLAWLGFQIKRDNAFSAVIVAIASGVLAFMGINMAGSVIYNFPKGLLAVIFCFAFAVIFLLVLVRKKSTRIIALIGTLAVMAALYAFICINNSGGREAGVSLEEDHEWQIVQSDTQAEIREGILIARSSSDGTFSVTVQDEDGKTQVYTFTFEHGTISIDGSNQGS